MSEYLFPSENLGHQCEKPADAIQPTEATAKSVLAGDPALKLADTLVHEISNQVTVILGISELLLEASKGDQTARKHIEEIVHAARRAARATHQLLELRVKQLPAAAYRLSDKGNQPGTLP